MASAELGNVVSLSIIGASATVLAVASEKDFTIEYAATSIDTTAKGDAAATNMCGSFYSIKIKVSCLYVDNNAAQTRLLTLLTSNTQVSFNIERSDVTDLTGTGTITRLVQSHAMNSAATFECDIDVDGALS